MRATDHICHAQAICFQCFRTGAERTRAKREAYAQRMLPFEPGQPELTTKEVVHREQMLAHLARSASGVSRFGGRVASRS